MNPTSKINPKNPALFPAARPADWGQLQHVRALMGLSRRRFARDDVLRLIDRREIAWAWDISRKNSRRPEVRIWRESLLAFLARESSAASAAPAEFTLAQVIEAVLPRPGVPFSPRAAAIGLRELQRRFLCCPTHLAGLVKDGELAVVPARAPREKTSILYQSAVEFLRRRTMSL